jgi:Flp pilus assembly protein TadD
VRIKLTKTGLIILFILMSLMLAACSGGGEAKPTEKEIIIDPNEGQTTEPGPPIATPTLRPTPMLEASAASVEGAPTPTNTLNPYDTLIFEGDQLRINEQYDAAAAKFAEAIQMDPTSPVAYIGRGNTYIDAGKYDEAITDFNFAINYDPENAVAYNARGVAWDQKGQPEQAIKDYSKAIELEPGFEKAITNMAIVNLLQGRIDEGLKYFTQAVEASPDNPEVYFNRGQAYIQAISQNFDESYIDLCIADFNQVQAFQPNDPNSLFNRGQCLSFKNDFQAAFQDYTAAIEQDPERAVFYLYRAVLYPDVGTQAQALSDAQKALDLSDDPDVRQQAQQMLTEIPKTPQPTPGPTLTPAP